MKRFTLLCSALLAGAVSFNSCQEAPENQPESTAVKFTSEIPTRVFDDQFEANDAISVFSLKDGATHTANAMYAFADGVFTSTSPIEIEEAGVELSYAALYPYKDGLALAGSYAIQADQSTDDNYMTSDLLFAKAEATSSVTPKLVFNHILSQLNVVLESTTIDFANATVFVQGATEVSYDLVAGTFEPAGDAVEIKAKAATTTANNYTVVFPAGKVAAQTGFIKVVTAAGVEYKWNLDFDFTFEMGTSYKCTANFEEEVPQGDGELEELEEGVIL